MSKEFRKYFGKKFHKLKSGYWQSFIPIQAHRWVWINHYGSIPPGMDIHHKDGDKSNNEIENLEMLSRSDHLKKHWEDPKLREERRKFLDEMRPKVHEWLRSDEGRKKQSESSKRGWKNRKTFDLICKSCNKQMKSKIPNKIYCSNNCYMKSVRMQRIYFIEKICPICNIIFMKDKFSPKRFCSISCGAKNSSKNRKKPIK
jgi:hypothetical protein